MKPLLIRGTVSDVPTWKNHEQQKKNGYCIFEIQLDEGLKRKVAMKDTEKASCFYLRRGERVVISGEMKSGGIIAESVFVDLNVPF